MMGLLEALLAGAIVFAIVDCVYIAFRRPA